MSMFKFMNLANLFLQLKKTSIRFPLAVISILIFSLSMINDTHEFYKFEKEFKQSLYLLSGLGFFYFTAIKIFMENHDLVNLRTYIVTTTIYGIFTYIMWGDLNNDIFFISGAIILFALFSPYLDKETDQDSVWYHAYLLCYNSVFGIIGGVALGLGFSAILASLKYLFGIQVVGEAFSDIWVISIFIFTPLFILNNLSEKFEFEKQDCGTPYGIYFLEKYILIPLILVYMAILYLYLGKIIIQWELPKGNLGYMIMGFGIIGTILHMIVYPLSNSDNKTITTFYDNFYKMLFFPLIMLFLSIFTRLNEYGMTEQRYAVLLCGIWLLIISVYFLFLKEKYHIKYIPTVLSILLVFAAIGPISAHKMSEYSQINNLKLLLKEHNLYERGRVLKLEEGKKIDFDVRKRISSIFDYLTKTNKTEKLGPMFKNLDEYKKSKEYKNCYNDACKYMRRMGLEYINKWDSKIRIDDFFYFNRKFYKTNLPTLIDEYKYMFQLSVYSKKPQIYIKGDNRIEIKPNTGLITINDNIKLDLSDTLKELSKYRNGNKFSKNDYKKYFDLKFKTEDYEADVYIKTINFQKIKDQLSIITLEGMVLIK